MDQICEKLYQDYYLQDKTPAPLKSSHWQQMHRQTQVELSRNVFVGYGFGDVQYNRWHHRLLAWAAIHSYLLHLPDRQAIRGLMPQARWVARRMGINFSYDCFRQVCALAFLKKNIKDWVGLTVLNIGDGYGFLSALIKYIFPDTKIVLVDLGKTLIFQAHYCQRVHSSCKHILADQKGAPQADFLYCPAENLGLLEPLTFDLAINIASMQEMNKATIDYYFNFLRAHLSQGGLFYCCNRYEKIMPGGEIARFHDYPWAPQDQHIADGLCDWYRYFLALRPTQNGLRLGKIRVPLVNYPDGPIHHRLTVLAP